MVIRAQRYRKPSWTKVVDGRCNFEQACQLMFFIKEKVKGQKKDKKIQFSGFIIFILDGY